MTSLSRNGHSSPLGKCDARIDVSLPQILKDEITALAVVDGMSTGEYCRIVLELHARGHLSVIRSMHSRRAEIDPEKRG